MTTVADTQSLYVDGAWRSGEAAPVPVHSPSTGAVVAEPPSASAADVEAALSAARRAATGWARMSTVERGKRLRALAGAISEHRESLASLIVTEMGKPIEQALGEVDFAASLISYNAEWDRRLEGEILPGDAPGEVIHLLRAPVGVVVAICPWNFPLGVLCRKLAPALLTGNTVVVKPSEISPLSTLAFMRLVEEHADLPPGVANVVTGAGETGAALVASPLADMVTFTGHRDTGKAVMAAAAANLTRVSLELGGKAPAIVWRDADLTVAVPAIVQARHLNAGQVCTSAERVLVHEDVLDEFTSAYVEAVGALRQGDPRSGVDIGPLASEAQLRKVTDALSRAVSEGASVVAGGDRPEFGSGYWHHPVVLRDVEAGMGVMEEETFGPITPIVGVASLDEALTLANASRYGLSAYLFSRDYQAIMRAIDELRFGEFYVNRSIGESVHAHHSGYGESGIGGEDGKWGMLRYTQIKTAYHHYG